MFDQIQKNAWKRNIGRRVSLSLILALSCVSVAVAASDDLPLAVGTDTIAGQTTQIRAFNFSANELINFEVDKPDGLSVFLAANSSYGGSAVVTLDDYHTRQAGVYSVVATSSTGEKTKETTFKVFAGGLDVTKSSLKADKLVVSADGQDYSNVSVMAQDALGNPLSGHSLKLISSRSEDQVLPKVGTTDQNGKVIFEISSEKAGLGAYTVMDMAEDSLFEQRLNLSFVDASAYLADAGGDLLKVANAADAGPLKGFDIIDLPPTVKPNQNISFKIKAVDDSDNTIQDYTGTIRFSAEGDNSSGVTLPANYKFLAEDLGQHAFNLGLSFAQAGTYKISVNDLTDKFKQGQVTVVVGDGSGGASTGTGSAENKPIIASPVSGTYSQAQQTISGTAKGGTTAKIFDNNQEIGSVPVGPTGKFTYQTKDLADGKHTIYVSDIDVISLAVIGTSDPIDLTIDTTPPALDDIQLDPSTGIKAGSVINVKVYSEKNLSQASLIFNFDIVPLTASIDDASVYVGTLQAPANPGVYKLNVLLVDQLSNEKTYENSATINVDANGGIIEKSPDLTIPVPVAPPVETTPVVERPPVDITPAGPSQVSGLIAYGSDKKVTLVWDAATSAKQVLNYKIYYGQDVKTLDKVVLTKDASTTWYVPNLENGKEYFFAIAAIDNDSKESLNKSEIVSGIPFVLEIKNALSTAPTKSIAQTDLHPAAYTGPLPVKQPAYGPEFDLIVLASGGLSVLWQLRKNRK